MADIRQLESQSYPLREYLDGHSSAPTQTSLRLFQQAYIQQEKHERGKPVGERADLSEYSHLLDEVIERMQQS